MTVILIKVGDEQLESKLCHRYPRSPVRRRGDPRREEVNG